MALVVKTSTVAPVAFPLACDPAVMAANPRPADRRDPWALAIYRETGDVAHPRAQLVVPPDACVATVRPLSPLERERAEAAAGERSVSDAAVWAEVAEVTRDHAAAGATGAADRALAAVSPEKRAAYRRHEGWMARHAQELTRAGLVSLSDLPHVTRGPTGYPVEALQAMDDPAPGSDLRWPPGLDSATVMFEVGQMVARVSTLGKAPRPSSDSPSGSPTTTPSGGNATARDSATDTCPATDPSHA